MGWPNKCDLCKSKTFLPRSKCEAVWCPNQKCCRSNLLTSKQNSCITKIKSKWTYGCLYKEWNAIYEIFKSRQPQWKGKMICRDCRTDVLGVHLLPLSDG